MSFLFHAAAGVYLQKQKQGLSHPLGGSLLVTLEIQAGRQFFCAC